MTRTSSIGIRLGHGASAEELVDDCVDADLAPKIGRLREQHRRQPLFDESSCGGMALMETIPTGINPGAIGLGVLDSDFLCSNVCV